MVLVDDCDGGKGGEGLRDERQRGGGGAVVVESENFVGVDDVEGVDRAGRNWGEDADGVEEEAEDVFLREPAVLAAVVLGAAE